MARDPAQGVIRWFTLLMLAFFITFAGVAAFTTWALWRLFHAVLVG